MKVLIFVQARLNSTRLPGKILYTLGQSAECSLSLIVKRLRKKWASNNISILTTVNTCDEAISDLATQLQVNSHRGEEEDVLLRYYKASQLIDSDLIVRITSDCPLIDPSEIERVLDSHLSLNNCDYSTNSFSGSTIVDGFDVEVFTPQALERANEYACLPSEREHVTFFFKSDNGFICNQTDPQMTYPSNYRLTLDTPCDYLAISTLVNRVENIYEADMRQYINTYRDEEIYKLNSHIAKNHGWLSAFEKDSFFNGNAI